MIKRFRVQNYKALRDVSLELTPMHVLIGPNDSGKTSILEAVAVLCRSVDRQLSHAFTGSWKGQQLIWHAQRDLPISLAASIEPDTGTIDYAIRGGLPRFIPILLKRWISTYWRLAVRTDSDHLLSEFEPCRPRALSSSEVRARHLTAECGLHISWRSSWVVERPLLTIAEIQTETLPAVDVS